VSRSALLSTVILAGVWSACGIDTTASGVFAPCTRSSDCQSGLSCPKGFCMPPDAGAPYIDASKDFDATDAGARDAGTAD
jgi:hypothetical protein